MIARNSQADRKVGMKKGRIFVYPKEKGVFFMKKGPWLIVLAAVLWSLDGMLRRSLFVLPPIIVVFYEHFLGFILLIPIIFKQRFDLTKIKIRSWGALGWVTLWSSILGTVLYTAALGQVKFIQFSVVVLLQQLQPLFVVLFAKLVLKEKLEKWLWLWLVIALSGAYLVTFPSLAVNWQTGKGTIVAALMAIGAAFSWGSSTAFSRYVLLKLSAALTTALRFGLASAIGIIIIFVMGQQGRLTSLNLNQWRALGAIVLSTGMVAMLIYYGGLKKTPAKLASICELTWPLSAVLIDCFYFHKSLTITQWIGAALLTASIFKVSQMAKKT